MGEEPIGPQDYNFNLTDDEIHEGTLLVDDWSNDFVAVCAGAKAASNHWVEENWRSLVRQISEAMDFGLVLFGEPDDYDMSKRLARDWHGPVLNLCGKINVRVSQLFCKKPKFILDKIAAPCILRQ